MLHPPTTTVQLARASFSVPPPTKLRFPDTQLVLPPPIKEQVPDIIFKVPPTIEDKVPELVCPVPICIHPLPLILPLTVNLSGANPEPICNLPSELNVI